jgi:hypothetical protein
VLAVSQTATAQSIRVYGRLQATTVSGVTGAQLAHHRNASRSLEGQTATAGGPAAERTQKSRSPVTFRSSGFD